ncbi:DUF4150 domain-containing protein [Phyllobacterium meliloti]|uniref:DUF4150 domain-containing protein n=1 Tax=Phyllobacterium meliloti TaxID=555317 RepID=UPI001D140910|nr:DUF4150 domain-containing protein [Phyllobacterium sp. T1293]UGX87052.1 DUF4150 domain-containing protein [Phyllobacterium sp. T1293]
MSLHPPREGSRDTSEGIVISKYPDVCRSPVCPIPYTIVAKQSDDANSCTSVRMTGQRAHNQGSIITCCTGDEPGTGLGVKSGTVSSVCHRKEHSNTVRFEGKWATRHGDEWWMNNKNTVGKLVYPKSTESFDPTPPFIETDTSEVKATSQPQVMRDFDIAPEPLIPNAEYAFLDTEKLKPMEEKLPKDVPSKPDEGAKKEPGKPSSGNRFWSGNLLMLQLLLTREAFKGLERQKELYDKGPPLTHPDGTPIDLDAPKRQLMQQLGLKNEQELQDWLKRQQEVIVKEDTPPKPQGRTDGNISVRGRKRRRNCLLRPYKDGCADALPYTTPHHVVADRVFRQPGTNTLYPGGISHADGLTLCVEGGTPIFNGPLANEHGKIHGIYNREEALLGAAGNPIGTAELGALEDKGVAAAAAVTGCDPVAMKKQLRTYHQGRGLSPNTRFRADPTGRLKPDPTNLGTGSTGTGAGGL